MSYGWSIYDSQNRWRVIYKVNDYANMSYVLLNLDGISMYMSTQFGKVNAGERLMLRRINASVSGDTFNWVVVEVPNLFDNINEVNVSNNSNLTNTLNSNTSISTKNTSSNTSTITPLLAYYNSLIVSNTFQPIMKSIQNITYFVDLTTFISNSYNAILL